MSGIYIYTKGLNYLEFIRYFNVWHYVMQVWRCRTILQQRLTTCSTLHWTAFNYKLVFA